MARPEIVSQITVLFINAKYPFDFRSEERFVSMSYYFDLERTHFHFYCRSEEPSASTDYCFPIERTHISR